MKPNPEKSDPRERLPANSPGRLLLSHFRASRDNWRAKALLRSARIRNLEQKIRDLQDSRSNWKDKAVELRAAKLSLENRLREVELQRDQLQAQLADTLAKKVPPLAI
jgi:chromosome segregation ATPase